jgi:hypothetical protein
LVNTRDLLHRRHATDLSEIANGLSERATEVTTPVYLANADRVPVAVGSGVLIQVGGARLLVTATHVLDERKNGHLLIQAVDSILPIGGEIATIYSRDAMHPIDDHIDVSVVRLTGAPWDSEPLDRYLTLEELDLVRDLPSRNSYAVIGYPESKQRNILKGTNLEAYAYRALALECLDGAYQRLGHNRDTSILLGFDKRRMWGPEGAVTAPDLYGMSGCGIWRFGRSVRFAKSPPKLAGIVIEWHRDAQPKHVLATRILPILAGVGQRFPDLR